LLISEGFPKDIIASLKLVVVVDPVTVVNPSHYHAVALRLLLRAA
jgi:hypothetical protein